MTIKELKDVLHLLDNDDEIFIDGKSLRVHDQKYNWNTYIRFEEPENTEQFSFEEKIKYLQMAWTIVSRMPIDFKSIDMIVSLSDLIDTKKGQTCLKSICEVKKEVEKRFENNSLPEGYQANK